MTEETMLRSRIFGVACVMIFASSIAMAQTAQNAAPPAASSASSDAAPKEKAKKHSKKKNQDGDQPSKSAGAEAKSKRGRFGSEAEAKAHCKGSVVWIDKDNFNHYAGSREYGRQPGAFACEG